MKNILPIIIAALTFAGGVKAQTVFKSGTDSRYYRIPAILNQNGTLWAFTDDRTNASGDIGWGNIKIIAQTSSDNGSTWSNEKTVADFNSSDTSNDNFNYAHGDAAVVCDNRESVRIYVNRSKSFSFAACSISPDSGFTA